MLCKYSYESNKQLGFNLSAVFLLKYELPNMLFALEYADIVFANEDESIAYFEVMNLQS